jgi:hypothetical protein
LYRYITGVGGYYITKRLTASPNTEESGAMIGTLSGKYGKAYGSLSGDAV